MFSYKFPLLSLEGIDASGKSTFAPWLADALSASHGTEFILTKYPGGTNFGKELRKLLFGEFAGTVNEYARQHLFMADILATTTEIILPALKAGKGVIADRFIDSTLHYAVAGCLLDESLIRSYISNCLEPMEAEYYAMDRKRILLDISPYEAQQRMEGTEKDYGDTFDPEYYARIRSAYVCDAAKHIRDWAIVDAVRSKEVVFDDVLKAANHFVFEHTNSRYNSSIKIDEWANY